MQINGSHSYMPTRPTAQKAPVRFSGGYTQMAASFLKGYQQPVMNFFKTYEKPINAVVLGRYILYSTAPREVRPAELAKEASKTYYKLMADPTATEAQKAGAKTLRDTLKKYKAQYLQLANKVGRFLGLDVGRHVANAKFYFKLAISPKMAEEVCRKIPGK